MLEVVQEEELRFVASYEPTAEAQRVALDEALGFADRPIVQWFADRARAHPNQVAFRHFHLGVWQDVTWREYRERVQRIALGLAELGVSAGDRVAVMGDACPEWLYLDLACQSIGAIPFGVYVTSPPEDVAYLVEDAGARVFVAEDQEYVDKVLDPRCEAPGVEHVVIIDSRGMFEYGDDRLMDFDDLERRGEARAQAAPTEWETSVAERKADDVVAIYYTSGTTGRPKGAMLSSRNIVSGWALMFAMKGRLGPTDRTVAYMPLAHTVERVHSVMCPILYGSIAHLPEAADTYRQAMVEVQPTILSSLPRTWEVQASEILVDMESSGWVKRVIYKMAMRARRSYFRAHWAGRRPPISARIGSWIAERLVCRPILDKFGYRDLRLASTGGAPVSRELLELWQLWGVKLRENFGMTECGGVATFMLSEIPIPGLAGRPAPGTAVALASDGEVVIRGPSVFQGYWDNPEATREAVDDAGWLHTGDIGEVTSDGFFRMIDRKKDILVTSRGQLVPCSEIEHVLKGSPYIRDAALVGDRRDYLGALLEMDFEMVAEWARTRKIAYTSYVSLLESEAVQALLDEEVQRANRRIEANGFPVVAQFRVIPKELDPEAGDEITPTRKVKRRQLAEKFSYLVNEMYETEEQRIISRSLAP